MDPQDQDQNNQTDSLKQQYQNILDKYSKEIKTQPEPVSQVASEPQVPVTDTTTQSVSEESVLPPLPQVPSENLLSEVPHQPFSDSLATIPKTPVTNGAIDEILNQLPQEYPPAGGPFASSEPPPAPPATEPTQVTSQTELPPVESTEVSPPTSEPTASSDYPSVGEPPVSPPPAYQALQPPPTQDVNTKLSEILDDKPEKPSSSSKFAKTFFFISLFIFLGVVGAIAYNLIKDQSSSSVPSNSNKIVVDEDLSEPSVAPENCVINDQTYSVNQSFTAADGCNTCTCQSDGTIACTELACELTPSESTSSSLPDTGSKAEVVE